MKKTAHQTSTHTLADFYRALDNQRAITITYLKEEKNDAGKKTGHLVETVRTVEPYRISTTAAGHIVIDIMDRETGESRRIRVDRIASYTLHRSAYQVERPTEDTTEPTFVPRTINQLIAYEIGRDERPANRARYATAA